MTKPKDPVDPEVAPEEDSPKTPFDTWLERGLHKLFDDVANQPVPEELLRLIRDDEKK